MYLEVTVKIPLKKLTGISKKVLLEQIDIDTQNDDIGDYLPIIRSFDNSVSYDMFAHRYYFDLEKSEIVSKQIKEG